MLQLTRRKTCNARTPAALAFLIAAISAALAPLLVQGDRGRADLFTGFPGFPSTFEGQQLSPLALTPREALLSRDFPGRVGRFSDGKREIIVRWVAEPTRRLHPAADCFRGIGYTITPLPLRKAATGSPMGCFRATRHDGAMTVCEAIRDEHGQTWPDASSWYWNALLGETHGPWWSVVIAEKS